jgi:hypothetical protein
MNLSLLRVYDPPFPKRRIGSNGDGGYVICDISGITYDALISGGVGDNITFEDHFSSVYSPSIIHCYDGTVTKAPETKAKINWFCKNIGPRESETETNLLNDLHANKSIFLKMDIEGSEILWLSSLPRDALRNVQQIAIEFHDSFWSESGFKVLQELLEDFTLVHLHPNNGGSKLRFKSIVVPTVFELTLVRTSLLDVDDLIQTTAALPTKLDDPNVWIKPDIYIDYQPFVDYTPPDVKPIHVVMRMCPESSKPLCGGGRPEWFSKEACFKSLFQLPLNNVNIHVLFDGTEPPSWLEGYPIKLVKIHAGDGNQSFIAQIDYIRSQRFDYNDIIYVLEDDYLHTKDWQEVLRDAFTIGSDSGEPMTDYVSLYDHPDKYTYEMYKNLMSSMYLTKTRHWRTVPSTTNTFASLVRTLLDDSAMQLMYENNDHLKFLRLNEIYNRRVLTPLPSAACHAVWDLQSPFIDWKAIAESVRPSFQPA